jgi:hypothetical protein
MGFLKSDAIIAESGAAFKARRIMEARRIRQFARGTLASVLPFFNAFR